MRELSLKSKKQINLTYGSHGFYEKDVNESIRSFRPGEWAVIKSGNKITSCIVNPYSKSTPHIQTVSELINEPESYIKKKIRECFEKRTLLGLGQNSRIIYGFEDGLPGVIVDGYENIIIVQINSAGFDMYRDLIRNELKDLTGTEVVYLDNEKYRENESLPLFPKEEIVDDVLIAENGLNYKVPKSVMQKVGYYYDHRVNRNKLSNTLQNIDMKIDNCVDLFCYVGSWGLHALKSGVERVDFVDQANMEDVVLNNVEANGFDKTKSSFIRKDVFKWLDEAIKAESKYDCVISDPPAFTKTAKGRSSAISGYEKLYNKIFKILSEKSLLVVASCTQYVTMEDLDKIILNNSKISARPVQLLDIGLQGWDHPVTSLKSKSNYIKYLLYYVE